MYSDDNGEVRLTGCALQKTASMTKGDKSPDKSTSK